MTLSTGQRRHHFKLTTPKDPAITPFAKWSISNRSFHQAFYLWLKAGGYGPSALHQYSVAARLALGYLNEPYAKIDPEADLERVRQYLQGQSLHPSTCIGYQKGLHKLAEYLYFRQNKAARPKVIQWTYYLQSLPDWLCEHVREFVAHKQKSWQPEDRYHHILKTLSPLCLTLRWMQAAAPLRAIHEITPQLWFAYLDAGLEKNYNPHTLNSHLSRLQGFLRFLEESGVPICQRMLLVQPLKLGPLLPRDVPISELRRLLEENEREAHAEHANQRRMGILDRAWLRLMLYSGLRTCEVRHLKLQDLSFENRRIRIERSKGLKDRMVYMNSATITALQAWLEVRESLDYFSEYVFFHRHQPLAPRYCAVRLKKYGKRCGVDITPHQLRHSCATLLLNAGAPVLSVQSLLGHEKVDTTLGYARLYDGTIAADYYRAMSQVERLFHLPESRQIPLATPAELVALVDSLGNGTLNEMQRETVQALREGILSLARKEEVKVH